MTFSLRPRRAATCSLVLLAALVEGCATRTPPLPPPLSYPRTPRVQDGSIGKPQEAQRTPETTVTALPSVPDAAPTLPPRAAAPAAPVVTGPGDEVSMAIEQTPLPIFIQILYGNVLKRAYSVDPAISARTDIVTFKTSRPVTRATMELLAFNLLRSYGIAVQDYDGLVRILPDTASGAMAPELRRGRALPETPEPLRPVFQWVELDIVRTSEISQWLKQILGTRVTIQEDPARNGFLLSGTQREIRTAIELIDSMDQPRMRGKVARRIAPAFMSATELSNRLTDVLTAQGYAVSTSAAGSSTPILVIPITAIGSVIVFANNEAVMEQVLKWARELDRPLTAQTSNGLYTYAVKYADAQELAKTLGEILGGGGAGGSNAPASPANSVNSPFAGGTGGAAAAIPQPTRGSTGGGRVVVNSATNTLIIRGSSADEYQQIMTLLRELDRPVKSAMIEVVIAELTRGASESLGIDWSFSRAGGLASGVNAYTGSAGAGGLNLALINSAHTVLTNITALATDNQARILSSPKLMARNGEAATIQVGKEVPIITSQQSTGTGLFGGSSGIIQSVQYRSTGVILRVRPVINSGNRLDLDIAQEVSSAESTQTGVSSSPTISTRRIETKMSLRDGSTVVLGGLIDRSTSGGTSGIPLLRDIPGLKYLFGATSRTTSETELLIMITPYVINDDFEAEGISEAMQKSLGDWAQSVPRARVVPQPDNVGLPAADPAPRSFGSQMLAPLPTARQTTAPAVIVPSPGASVAPAPAPVAAPANASDAGVTMKIEQAPAASANTPAGARPKAGVPTSPTPTPTQPKPVEPPPGPEVQLPGAPASGRVVEDPKIRQEIEDLLKKK